MLAIDGTGHVVDLASERGMGYAAFGACLARVPIMRDSEPVWRSVEAGMTVWYAIAKDGTLWRRAFTRRDCIFNLELPLAFEPLNWTRRWVKVREAMGIVAGLDEHRELWLWDDREVLPEAARDLGGVAQVTLTQATASKRWQDFCLGNYTTFAVADDGTLWVDALNAKPFDRTPKLAASLAKMTRLDAPVRFTRVFCNANGLHVLALDTLGALWGLGDNSAGELGGDRRGVVPGDGAIPRTPIQRVTQKRWRDVAVGSGFTIAIAENGSLWGWGSLPQGVPGWDSGKPGTPQFIDHRFQWVSVAAGSEFAAALTSDGAVYSWGKLDDHIPYGAGPRSRLTRARILAGQVVALPADPLPH